MLLLVISNDYNSSNKIAIIVRKVYMMMKLAEIMTRMIIITKILLVIIKIIIAGMSKSKDKYRYNCKILSTPWWQLSLSLSSLLKVFRFPNHIAF